jgi:hypothetical protein
MGRLAKLLGCTEGQAYTIVLALALTLTTTVTGLPPTLRARPAAQAAEPPPAAVAGTDDAGTPALQQPEDTSADQTTAFEPPGGGTSSPSGAAPPLDLGGVSGGMPPAALPPPGSQGIQAPPGSIEVFAKATKPGAPHGVAVASNGDVYVTTDNAAGRGAEGPSEILRYSRDGDLQDRYTVKGQSPARQHGLLGIEVDAQGQVFVIDPSNATVLQVDVEAGSQKVAATIPDIAPCLSVVVTPPCEPGPADNKPLPRDLLLASNGDLLVSDGGQATIWRLTSGGKLSSWYQGTEEQLPAAPDGGLAGLAVDHEGDVLVLERSSSGAQSVREGIVYRIAVRPDGKAGQRVEVARTGGESLPTGITASAAGKIYLTLSGTDALVVLDESGKEVERFSAAKVEESAGVPLDAPSGITFFGESLLVANTSDATGEPKRWVVFEVIVGETKVAPRR